MVTVRLLAELPGSWAREGEDGAQSPHALGTHHPCHPRLGKVGPCSMVAAGNSWEVAFQGAIKYATGYAAICQ